MQAGNPNSKKEGNLSNEKKSLSSAFAAQMLRNVDSEGLKKKSSSSAIQ